MDVSENSGTPKSSILIRFSIINDPFWGTPIFGNTHIQLGFLSTLSIPANSSASGGCASLSIKFFWNTAAAWQRKIGWESNWTGKKTNRWNLFKAQFSTFFSRFAYQAISSSNIGGRLFTHIWHISGLSRTYRFRWSHKYRLGCTSKNQGLDTKKTRGPIPCRCTFTPDTCLTGWCPWPPEMAHDASCQLWDSSRCALQGLGFVACHLFSNFVSCSHDFLRVQHSDAIFVKHK